MNENKDMSKEKNVVSLPDMTHIEREAAEWFVRFEGEDVSEADHAAFREWCNQSDQHKDALERIAQFWGGMEVFRDLKDYAVADDMTRLLQRDRNSSRRIVTRRAIGGVIAASLVAVCAVAVFQYPADVGQRYHGAFETAIGEQRTVDLPDGSRVVFNTDSAAEISFSRTARIVQLSKGEAYFEVAPNNKKPFSVETVEGVVTAVGTAFSVRVHEGRIDVLVKEGRVALAAREASKRSAVSKPAAKTPAPLEVSAGQSVLFAQKVEAIDVVEPAAVDKRLDWQDGMLAFKGEALEDVIAELGRYTDMTIEISDPDLRRQEIVTYYRIGDIETMLDGLQIMADLEVERVGDRHVRLYRVN